MAKRSTKRHLTAAPARAPAATARAPVGAAVAPACACGRLRRGARALTQLYDDAMAPSGLRITQFSLLRTVARDGKARISDLAATLLLDRTALSRNLDPLLARGLLAVTPGRDARTREVALTRSGATALRTAMPCWKRAQAEVAKRLGSDKLDALIATLAEVEMLHPGNDSRDHRLDHHSSITESSIKRVMPRIQRRHPGKACPGMIKAGGRDPMLPPKLGPGLRRGDGGRPSTKAR